MYEICAHYSDDHQYGDWYRLEEAFIVERSSFALDGATAYSMASRSDGVAFSTKVSVLVVIPHVDDDGHYDKSIDLGLTSVDLNDVPIEDISFYVQGMGCKSLSEFAEEFVEWQRGLGELVCTGNVCDPGFDWCTCPNGPTAVKLMNTIMHCELPENWFDDLYFQLGLSSELTCREASVEASCGEVLDNAPEVPVASTERGDK